jgi:hypothetical protein
MTAHCCPYPPGFVPRIQPECRGWDWTASRNEIRGLANDLAEKLPDWSSTTNPSVNVRYDGLKAAAIQMARAPRCVQRAVVESYCRAYCEEVRPDYPKTSGMFLLMRVLFVHPHISDHTEGFGGWMPIRWSESSAPIKPGAGWPVYEDPSGRFVEIDRSRGGILFHFAYHALAEYDYNAAHFRMRTPAELAALEIRGRP